VARPSTDRGRARTQQESQMSDLVQGAISLEPERRATPWVVTWLTWPLLFAATILAIAHAVVFDWNYGVTLGVVIGGAAITLVVLEILYPLDPRWRMTWRSFLGRDIKYFVAGGLSAATTNLVLGLV
jgi:hypothetical protein